jgi:N-acetylglucosamine-6-phosphate deacetylase
MRHHLLIYNGKILAETHLLPKGYVLVHDGKIASIGEDWKGLHAEREIDAGGLLVCPGFIDMHTHGIKNVDFMEAEPAAIVEGLREYAAFGVTRVVGSTLANPFDVIIDQVKNIRKAKEHREYGDILHGVHIEGPWLAPRCRGGHALEYLRTPEKDDVDRLIGEVGDVIRTVTYAPELPNSVWLTEELSRHGIVGVLGHTEASYEDAERVILAGARHVTHMYDTTMGVLTYKDGRKVYVAEGVLRMIDEDPNINGNLTGSAATMNVALRRLREYTGIPTSEAILWGSLNPATTLGIERETGSIRIGKFADITLIDEDFNVRMTFLKGRPVF